MDTQAVINLATRYLQKLPGKQFDVLRLGKPATVEVASSTAKVISKLSPLVGNLIEFGAVDFLNATQEFRESGGRWRRQDPGFPDTIFEAPAMSVSDVSGAERASKIRPGFEVKAWFPLATEITARFRDSQNRFAHDEVCVAVLAWLPSELVSGVPTLLGTCVVSAKSVAIARDSHYHNPPEYVVVEPEDTTERTRNLQQSNTAGYRFQGTEKELLQAQRDVVAWGAGRHKYDPRRDYQVLVRGLLSKYPYRLDTNFSKIDRIAHVEIETFKGQILDMRFCGLRIGEWAKLISVASKEAQQREEEGVSGPGPNELQLRSALSKHLGIG
jgi:hypothetical protein